MQAAMPTILSSTSSSSLLGYAPTSTLDTFATGLPPALLSAIPTRCGFHNQAELLHHLEEHWKGRNTSLLVKICPDVCVTIYGTGNPDISGVGAMMSYILQFILIACCGPVLDLLEIYVNFRSQRAKHIIYLIYVDSQVSVHLGCSFLTFALMVASLIRAQQGITVFELGFVADLAGLQFLLNLAMFIQCGILVYKAEKREDRLRLVKAIYQRIAAASCQFVNLSLAMLANAPLYDEEGTEIMRSVSQYCHDFNSLRFPRWGEGFASWVISAYLCVSILLIPILLQLEENRCSDPVAKIRRTVSASFKRFPVPAQKILSACRKAFARAGFTSLAMYIWVPWLAACIWEISRMEQSRQLIHDALGSAYQDLSWGFGQVLAVMAWIPVFFELGQQLLEIIHAELPETHCEEQSVPLTSDPSFVGGGQTDVELAQMSGHTADAVE